MNPNLVRAFYIFLLLSVAQCSWSMSSTLCTSGRLLDANGNPKHYYKQFGNTSVEWPTTLTTQMKFYGSETTTTCIYTLNTTCLAKHGYFTLNFSLPWSVLQKEPLYYSLAIDADQNGLTSSDQFAGRFTWGVVPWALSAKPSHNFTTHYGHVTRWTFNAARNGWLEIAAFEAPAGGIEFNRMMVDVGAAAGYGFSFGIYDLQGHLVAYSGKITPQIGINGFLEIKLPQIVKLEPSTCYYTAYTRSNQEKTTIYEGLKPVQPMYGFVKNLGGDGSLPATFDPDALEYSDYACPIPIVLTLDGASPSKAAMRAGGSAKIPWISMKDVKIENTATPAN